MGERFVMMALRNTDVRIKNDKPVSPSFLFASLLWHEVLAAWKKLEGQGMPTIPALTQAMDQVAQVQAEKLAIPRRYAADMKEIWAMQPRLLQRSGRRPYRLLENPRFRAAYDFCCCAAPAGSSIRKSANGGRASSTATKTSARGCSRRKKVLNASAAAGDAARRASRRVSRYDAGKRLHCARRQPR